MAETARNPDALQQEIDRTRDELARTIDTIAERVSPKNVARRGMGQVKESAASVRERLPGGDHSGAGDLHPELVNHGAEDSSRHAGHADSGGRHEVATGRAIPSRNVLIAGAGVVVVVTVVVIWRRKH